MMIDSITLPQLPCRPSSYALIFGMFALLALLRRRQCDPQYLTLNPTYIACSSFYREVFFWRLKPMLS